MVKLSIFKNVSDAAVFAATELPSGGSILSLLRIPVIPVVGLSVLCGTAAFAFFDVTLSAYLSSTVKTRIAYTLYMIMRLERVIGIIVVGTNTQRHRVS